MTAPSPVYALAGAYVERRAALDPVGANLRGIRGHEAEMTDYSPEGVAVRAAYDRETLASLAGLPAESATDQRARAVMEERLRATLAAVEIGEPLRELRILNSPLQSIRECFANPPATEEERRATLSRLTRVPEALGSLRRSLEEGAGRGLLAARRRALACAEQAAVWSGERTAAPFFQNYIARVPGGSDNAEWERAARAATDAYAAMGRYLREEYAPRAPEQDAVGPERHAVYARLMLGADLDPLEATAWAWDDLDRIRGLMAATARAIVPGGSVAEAAEALEHDPVRRVPDAEGFRTWVQQRSDQAIAELADTHFDIPEPLRRVEAVIPPPGGALAAHYRAPSEDFSIPGRVVFPLASAGPFPLWSHLTTVYHEAVPGHHLQVGGLRALGDKVSRFQRVFAQISGYGEGWALYAERFMEEIGAFEEPAYLLGRYSSEAWRAARVIIDLGMHLQLRIPSAQSFHPGETWTPELGLAFMLQETRRERPFLESELVRYLGWPAQATCYKLGERAWLRARDAARAKHGATFSLRDFHARALGLGPMGLERLESELAAAV